MCEVPLYVTNKTVKDSFWPWLSGNIHFHLSSSCLCDRKRTAIFASAGQSHNETDTQDDELTKVDKFNAKGDDSVPTWSTFAIISFFSVVRSHVERSCSNVGPTKSR
jgi:hypothetical protein